MIRSPGYAALGAAVTIGVAGCGDLPPRGQVVVYVDTDAPLPAGPGEPSEPLAPPPLFDRVRFDVYAPGAAEPCARCSRDFAIHRALFRERKASIGIIPEPGRSGYRVRVRLYREAFVAQTEPIARSALDATVALPAIGDEGIVEGSVFLPTDAVGDPLGTPAAPDAWTPGAPAASRETSWPHAQRASCASPARDGEICVPGGAFWMGHPLVPGGSGRDDEATPRLVVMSPFFLDATEVTVGMFRAWLAHQGARSPVTDPVPWSGAGVGLWARDWCTFPPDATDDSRDHLPLNCISFEGAQRFCRERDGMPADLPSEAQLEYATGHLEGRDHPWGADEPSCLDAVHARGGAGNFADRYAGDCRPLDSQGGPLGPGSAARDAVALEQAIVDLAGNLAELARDGWNAQDDPCWTAALMKDPLCTADPSTSPVRVARAGSWASEPYELRGAFRIAVPDDFAPDQPESTQLGPLVGFRCARPAPPQLRTGEP